MPASETLELSVKAGRFLPLWLQTPILFLTQLGPTDLLIDAGPPMWVLVKDRAGTVRRKVYVGRDPDEVDVTHELMLEDLELLTEQEFLDKWGG